MLRTLLALVLGLTTAGAFGATYYVSGAGNDLNAGLSEGAPWSTVEKVNAAMSSGLIQPGDKVLFKRGDVFSGSLQPRSGLPGLPVVVGAYSFAWNGPDYPNLHSVEIHDRSHVVLTGLGVVGSTEGEKISIENSSDVRIEDLRTLEGDYGIHLSRGNLARIVIRNSTMESADVNGVYVGGYNMLSDVTVENSTISGNRLSGMNVAPGTNQGLGLTLRKVTISANQKHGFTCRGVSQLRLIECGVSGNLGIGVAIYNAAWDINIEGLVAVSNSEAGIQFSQDTNRANESITDVRIVDSKFNRNGLDGIALRGRGSSITVANSEASSNWNDGFNIRNNWQGVLFEHCSANENGVGSIMAGAGDGFSFHNTSSGVVSRCYAKDNAKSAAGHIDASSVDMVNNLFLHSTRGTWPLIHGSGTGTFNVWHNTIVTSATSGTGIRLQNGATADVRNNIVVGGNIGITKSQMAAFAEDNNILWGMATPFQYFKAGARSLVANPLFQDPLMGDYRPSYGSPAVDYATWVGVFYDHAGTRRREILQYSAGLGVVPYGDVGAFEAQ